MIWIYSLCLVWKGVKLLRNIVFGGYRLEVWFMCILFMFVFVWVVCWGYFCRVRIFIIIVIIGF